jgi:hypothetical protein
MLKTYLLVFVFMLIVIQPVIIKTLNSSSLGRLLLISSIIFCTVQNKLVGLALTVLSIAVLNETGQENFEVYEQEEEDEETNEDNEMIEKKMITPVSSYNVVPIITPENAEPDAFSESEPFTAF